MEEEREKINELINDVEYFFNWSSLDRYVDLKEALKKIPGLKERYDAYKIAKENLALFIENLETIDI